MADNLTTPLNNGTVIAADEISGVLYPRTKISYGTDGLATDVSVSNPLPSRDTAVKEGLDAVLAKLIAAPATEAKLEAVRSLLTGLLMVDATVRGPTFDRGKSVGTTAIELIPANASRRGFGVQNQSDTATVYINGTGAALVGPSSLRLLPGDYFESSTNHSGVGSISVISTEASTPVYAREW